MDIEVLEATEEDFPVVQNLVRFYIYELSGIMDWECPEDGLFGGCDELPEYWQTHNPLTDENQVEAKPIQRPLKVSKQIKSKNQKKRATTRALS